MAYLTKWGPHKPIPNELTFYASDWLALVLAILVKLVRYF
jgi:hypothetical protein